MIPENAVSYRKKIVVSAEHLDNLNHVNNVIYLKWVNEVSEEHWNELATEALLKNYFWVVLRHEIDYKNQAFLGEEVIVDTYVGETSGVKSVRHVIIHKEGKVLAKAATTWCLVDMKTQRPTRVKKDVLAVLNREESS